MQATIDSQTARKDWLGLLAKAPAGGAWHSFGRRVA
jgi:hypothetical protein